MSRMSRMRRQDDGDHEEHPSEAWLIALADMMTLLMVTFLMMFAISNMDLEKFKVFQEAFADGTGAALPALPGNGLPAEGIVSGVVTIPAAAPTPSPTKVPNKNVLDKAALRKLQEEITKALAKAGLADRVEATITSRGLVVYVTSAVLFRSGEADVTEPGKLLLDGLGPILSRIGNDLVVEGHTDARPISSERFASNWELSGARAAAVARRLMDSAGVSHDRVSIGGYADTRPRQDAATEEAYATNRRVEIVVESPR
ncbi:MAG: OmpA/MotB domain protein [Frankiales bacterium]|jgi:chemotaxis protein MotB|nr:OmpA/MotB domain protein [Frankiales bacterium]